MLKGKKLCDWDCEKGKVNPDPLVLRLKLPKDDKRANGLKVCDLFLPGFMGLNVVVSTGAGVVEMSNTGFMFVMGTGIKVCCC